MRESYTLAFGCGSGVIRNADRKCNADLTAGRARHFRRDEAGGKKMRFELENEGRESLGECRMNHNSHLDVAKEGETPARSKALRRDTSSHDLKHRWGIILAGGDGVRLRELTRLSSGDDRPKQSAHY